MLQEARGGKPNKILRRSRCILSTKVSCKVCRSFLYERTLMEVKAGTNSWTSSVIIVTFERCFPMFFDTKANSSESVSTTICSLVPLGINRMPSLSASTSARKFPPLLVCHAPQPRSLPCIYVSCRKALSGLIFRVPCSGGVHRAVC